MLRTFSLQHPYGSFFGFLALVLGLISAGPAAAQSGAALTGTVANSAGAPVEFATITRT
jgi:hypothetical protein